MGSREGVQTPPVSVRFLSFPQEIAGTLVTVTYEPARDPALLVQDHISALYPPREAAPAGGCGSPPQDTASILTQVSRAGRLEHSALGGGVLSPGEGSAELREQVTTWDSFLLERAGCLYWREQQQPQPAQTLRSPGGQHQVPPQQCTTGPGEALPSHPSSPPQPRAGTGWHLVLSELSPGAAWFVLPA